MPETTTTYPAPEDLLALERSPREDSEDEDQNRGKRSDCATGVASTEETSENSCLSKIEEGLKDFFGSGYLDQFSRNNESKKTKIPTSDSP